MSPRVRRLVPGVVALATALVLAAPAAAATATGPAPGAPGTAAAYLPADKSGVGTSATTPSRTWLTVQKEGGLGELFYPDLSTPSARALRFLVADTSGHSAAWAAGPATTLTDSRSLSYRQTFKDPSGRWQLTATYATDPARSTVLADIAFSQAKPGNRFTVYAVYEPTLADSRTANSGATQGDALTATHGAASSALAGSPAFTAHVERLPRHQRRLERPARRRPHGLALHARRPRQRRADRPTALDGAGHRTRRRARLRQRAGAAR